MMKRRVFSKIPPSLSHAQIFPIFVPSENILYKGLHSSLAHKAQSMGGLASQWIQPHTFYSKDWRSPSLPILALLWFSPEVRPSPER